MPTATGVKRLHLMAGIADRRDAEAMARYRRSVAMPPSDWRRKGIDLVLEPINARNMPGYFLNDFGVRRDLIARSRACRT